MPTLSAAVEVETLTVPLTVAPACGAVTDTVGGIVSAGPAYVRVKTLLPGAANEKVPPVTGISVPRCMLTELLVR